MKSKTKYVYVILKIRNGEYEYISQSVSEISKRKNVLKFGEDAAKTFYSGTPDKYSPDSDWWNFNGGEVAVRLESANEITKEEFEVIKKYLY